MPEELSLDPGPYRRRIFILKKNWKGVPLFMFVMRYLLTVLNNVTNELNRMKKEIYFVVNWSFIIIQTVGRVESTQWHIGHRSIHFKLN